MIGNLGLTALTALGAPFPLPQVVTAAVLFLLSWQLRPVVFSTFGPLLGLTLMAAVVVGGSWPMRRPRIGGRAPHRWVLGHVNLQLSPRTGRRLGGRVGFARPRRVGGLAWVIPVAATGSTVEPGVEGHNRPGLGPRAAVPATGPEPSHRPPRQVQPAIRSRFPLRIHRNVPVSDPAAREVRVVETRTSGATRSPDLVGVGASGVAAVGGGPPGPKSNLEVMRSLLS